MARALTKSPSRVGKNQAFPQSLSHGGFVRVKNGVQHGCYLNRERMMQQVRLALLFKAGLKPVDRFPRDIAGEALAVRRCKDDQKVHITSISGLTARDASKEENSHQPGEMKGLQALLQAGHLPGEGLCQRWNL